MSNCKSMVVYPFEANETSDDFEFQNDQVIRLVNESNRRAKMREVAARKRRNLRVRRAVEIFKISVIGFFCSVGLLTFIALVLL